jgi:O-antigen ligase
MAALALFSLIAYIGIIHTENYADGFSIANKFLSLPAIYFFVSVLLQSEPSEEARIRKAEFLLFSFLIGLTALNVIGALTFLGVVGETQYALPLVPLSMHHIWFSNSNALGLYTAVSLLLFSRHGRSARVRAFLGFFLLLSTFSILLSLSRTAWFGTAATAVIMATPLIKSKKTIVLVGLLSVLTFTSLYRFVPLVHDRIDLIAGDIALYSADKKAVSSIGGRILMWKAAFRMFTWHPYIGVGTGDFQRTMKVFRRSRLVPAYLLAYNQPHNMYLFSMATNGIAGLTALLYIFYRSLRSSAPIIRSDGAGKLFAFLAMATAVHFMVAGFMDSFFNIQILRFSFAFIMGVCIRSSANCAGPAAPPRCPPP